MRIENGVAIIVCISSCTKWIFLQVSHPKGKFATSTEKFYLCYFECYAKEKSRMFCVWNIPLWYTDSNDPESELQNVTFTHCFHTYVNLKELQKIVLLTSCENGGRTQCLTCFMRETSSFHFTWIDRSHYWTFT